MRYIAFLRGINVSGQKLIKMEDLRKHFEMPGFKNVVTYIQSGNVLFDTNEADRSKLKMKIEKQLLGKLGYDVPVVLRSLEDIGRAIAANPFHEQKIEAPLKLYVVFLSEAPAPSLHTALGPYTAETEQVRIVGKEMYIITGGIGNSKLTLSVIEKKLGVTATMRNWATTNKVLTL